MLHYGERGRGVELQSGMTFTVEPMVNAGKRHVRLLPDGWTVITRIIRCPRNGNTRSS